MVRLYIQALLCFWGTDFLTNDISIDYIVHTNMYQSNIFIIKIFIYHTAFWCYKLPLIWSTYSSFYQTFHYHFYEAVNKYCWHLIKSDIPIKAVHHVLESKSSKSHTFMLVQFKRRVLLLCRWWKVTQKPGKRNICICVRWSNTTMVKIIMSIFI